MLNGALGTSRSVMDRVGAAEGSIKLGEGARLPVGSALGFCVFALAGCMDVLLVGNRDADGEGAFVVELPGATGDIVGEIDGCSVIRLLAFGRLIGASVGLAVLGPPTPGVLSGDTGMVGVAVAIPIGVLPAGGPGLGKTVGVEMTGLPPVGKFPGEPGAGGIVGLPPFGSTRVGRRTGGSVTVGLLWLVGFLGVSTAPEVVGSAVVGMLRVGALPVGSEGIAVEPLPMGTVGFPPMSVEPPELSVETGGVGFDPSCTVGAPGVLEGLVGAEGAPWGAEPASGGKFGLTGAPVTEPGPGASVVVSPEELSGPCAGDGAPGFCRPSGVRVGVLGSGRGRGSAGVEEDIGIDGEGN